MIQNREDKLLNILNLGLRSQNEDLKIEIINYIATENLIEAIHILKNYIEDEEIPAIKEYIKRVIEHLKKPLVIQSKKTLPYRELEDTKTIEEKDALILRWSSSFPELPKESKKNDKIISRNDRDREKGLYSIQQKKK